MKKHLHLVSFDIPYPPNYGGIIDVFYKLAALKKLGIKIILHCFKFNREEASILHDYCHKVYYYPRNNYFKSLLSKEYPFIVKSRGNANLLKNLTEDSYPILFDGLHTTYVLNLAPFSHKKVYVRAHNIEHNFYQGLARSENQLFKKQFFKQEAKKLEKYENILHKVNGVFTIAPFEQNYFTQHYGNHCYYVPAFHKHSQETLLNKSEKIVLYHGNLLVSDNVKAAFFLINTYKNSNYKLVIASSFTNKSLLNEIDKHKNIEFCKISDSNLLYSLFEKTHVNVLPTYQKTGIKLKLLNTLYQGRFIITNSTMIEDTGLESLCWVANTSQEFLNKTETLFQKDFTKEMRNKRLKVLESFHPLKSAQRIVDVIYSENL